MSKVDKIFKAISDPTRREILQLLMIAGTALTINAVSDHFDTTRQAVTKHIKILEHAGLVKLEDKGRQRLCFAEPKPLKHVNDWLHQYEKFWNEKLDALGDHLKKKI